MTEEQFYDAAEKAARHNNIFSFEVEEKKANVGAISGTYEKIIYLIHKDRKIAYLKIDISNFKTQVYVLKEVSLLCNTFTEIKENTLEKRLEAFFERTNGFLKIRNTILSMIATNKDFVSDKDALNIVECILSDNMSHEISPDMQLVDIFREITKWFGLSDKIVVYRKDYPETTEIEEQENA